MAPTGTRRPGDDHPSSAADPSLVPSGRPSLGAGRVEAAALGELSLEAGGPRLSVTLAYRHDGPGPDAPQVLVVHALTGSADAAGDWWEPLIGPGRALDTTRVGVLCANLLGGRYGSTGPTSIDAATGEPFGRSFPQPSARDEARVLWALADTLGIDRFALVTGGSLGGMIAQEVALDRPDAVDHLLPMAAPAATGAMAIAWNHIQLEAIDALGERGLELARQLAMTTYRSEADFDERFARGREADGRFSIASYLDHQGRKLVDRFDPDTYRVLVRIMDGHDVGRDRGGIVTAYRELAAAGVGVTGVGIPGDILYGPDQVHALVDAATAAGADARYREIRSTKGHDAFLVEWDQLTAIVAEALEDGIGRGLAAGTAEPERVAGAA
ncbi:MAG TPA: homoserine O-acetyltransferase [Candidatus Limnocylindrales bacterium]|nr:homoserine O-acetyltransferase [Candidatus Limnocylindrales bacterium]